MPEKLMRCVKAVQKADKKGKYNPWAVCISSTGLKPHRKEKNSNI